MKIVIARKRETHSDNRLKVQEYIVYIEQLSRDSYFQAEEKILYIIYRYTFFLFSINK